jgi:hypothetical protein
MKNWKTTLVGLGVGAGNAFLGGMDWQTILMSVGFGFLGILSKDFSNSGTGIPGKF